MLSVWPSTHKGAEKRGRARANAHLQVRLKGAVDELEGARWRARARQQQQQAAHELQARRAHERRALLLITRRPSERIVPRVVPGGRGAQDGAHNGAQRVVLLGSIVGLLHLVILLLI